MEHKSFMYRHQWVVFDRDEQEYSMTVDMKGTVATLTFTTPQSAREFIDKMIERGLT